MKEADIQKQVVKAVRKLYKGAKVIANPLSEVQMNYDNPRAKNAALSKAKAMGWQANQPDLLIFIPKNRTNLAIELKTPETNPFRKIRGGGMWIHDSKGQDAVRVRDQMLYLFELDQNFDFIGILTSVDQVLAACEAAINNYHQPYQPDFEIVTCSDAYNRTFTVWTHEENILAKP